MKKPIFLFLICFYFFSSAFAQQRFEGTWRGVMVQDSPVARINFEMVLENKEGRIIGYLYRLFIVEDSLIYNTVKITARVSDNMLIVEDDESVSRNFEERANRKIKAAYFFKLDPKSQTTDSLKGEWTTSRFKNKYMSVSGTVAVKREPEYETTQLFKRLEEKQLQNTVAFIPKQIAPDVAGKTSTIKANTTPVPASQDKKDSVASPVTIAATQKLEKKDSVQQQTVTQSKPPITQQQPAVIKSQTEIPSSVVNNTGKPVNQTQEVKKDSIKTNTAVANTNVKTQQQPVTTPPNKNQGSANETTAKNSGTPTSATIKKDSVRTNVAVNQPKPQTQQQTNKQPASNSQQPVAPPVVKKENNPSTVLPSKTTTAAPVVQQQSQLEKTDAAVIKETVTTNQKPATVAPAPTISNPVITTRATEVMQTLDITGDSVTLALYDNGEIDGDIVSAFANNEKIIDNVTLKASAYKKTIYLKPGETVQLTLFAENLGNIPPNTGLLIVTSGENRYQVFFSSTLSKSSAVLLRKL